jgi:type VI protein secretion system component VasF
MKTEHQIDDFIRREKQTEPNPFLSSRVMANIEKLQKPEVKKNPVWQVAAVSASVAAVVFLGISIGNSYVDSISPETVMNINDSQMENLGYYNLENYE